MRRAFLVPLATIHLPFAAALAAPTAQADYWSNFRKVCAGPGALVEQLAHQTWSQDFALVQQTIGAAFETPVSLSQPEEPTEKLRFGARWVDAVQPTERIQATSQDGALWLDWLAYPRTLHAQRVMKEVNQGHSGVLHPDYAAFITIFAEEGSHAVAAVVRNGRTIFSAGWALPFTVHTPSQGDNTAAEYEAVSAAIDRVQSLLQQVGKGLELPDESRPAPAQLSPSSLRIAGLARVWSEARYNFVFLDERPGLDLDRAFEEFLPKVAAAESDREYLALLEEFVALLGDGHCWVSPHKELREDSSHPPVRVLPIEGRAVIVDAAEDLHPVVRPGMVITAIDGLDVSEFLQESIHPRIAASTPQDLEQRAALRLLRGPAESTTELTLLDPEGASSTARLARDPAAHQAFAAKRKRPAVVAKQLEDGVLYLALNTFADPAAVEQFDAHFDTLLASRGLILDLRENGGGSSSHGYAILARLIDAPTRQTSRWRTRIHRPAFHAWGHPNDWYEAEGTEIRPRGETPYLGPVVVLTSPRTYSAAEDFLVPLRATNRATLIGEPTGGSTGQPFIFDVHAARVAIVSKWDYFPDGTEFVGTGIEPDVTVALTQQDVADGRDPVLERALAFLAQER